MCIRDSGGALQYILLFVGGIALAITYGRVIRCVWAVSYTHLDVYKRQVLVS